MRITNQMSYQLLSSAVLNNQQSVYESQQRVSSGERISIPSDDPVDFGRLARMRDSLAGVQRYAKCIDQARSELATVDSALQQAGNLFQRAMEVAVMASDGTKTDAERQSMGEEVNSLLTGLLNIANTTYDGHTVFSGTSGVPEAYVATDANSDGRLDTFTYQGNAAARELSVTESSTIQIGFPGADASSTQAVFQTGSLDLFATLRQFRDDLLNGVSIADSSTMQQLQEGHEHLTNVLAVIGGKNEALVASGKMLTQSAANLINDISDIGAVDIAKAMMALTSKQQAYQAALSATAGLNKSTLIDWLR